MRRSSLLKALPRMAKPADSDKLREAFEHHRDQTEMQSERLEKVLEVCGARPRAKTCDAIIGMVEEGKELIGLFKAVMRLMPA